MLTGVWYKRSARYQRMQQYRPPTFAGMIHSWYFMFAFETRGSLFDVPWDNLVNISSCQNAGSGGPSYRSPSLITADLRLLMSLSPIFDDNE